MGTIRNGAGGNVQLQRGSIVGQAFQLLVRKLLDDVFHDQLALGAKGPVLVSFKFLEQIGGALALDGFNAAGGDTSAVSAVTPLAVGFEEVGRIAVAFLMLLGRMCEEIEKV